VVSCPDEECDGSVNNTERRPAGRQSHSPRKIEESSENQVPVLRVNLTFGKAAVIVDTWLSGKFPSSSRIWNNWPSAYSVTTTTCYKNKRRHSMSKG